MRSPEELVREKIDKLLTECGWILQNRNTINLSAGQGIAIREGLLFKFPAFPDTQENLDSPRTQNGRVRRAAPSA